MTAPDARALLDELEKLRGEATPGPWTAEQHERLRPGCMCMSCWEPVDAWDIREVDGPDCPQHGCWHNISLGQADAALIVAEHNALPALTAALRGALDLADELAGAGDRFRARWKKTGDAYDEGGADALDTAAARLRSTVAAALESGDREGANRG